jgi:hypothetical protein
VPQIADIARIFSSEQIIAHRCVQLRRPFIPMSVARYIASSDSLGFALRVLARLGVGIERLQEAIAVWEECESLSDVDWRRERAPDLHDSWMKHVRARVATLGRTLQLNLTRPRYSDHDSADAISA